MGKVKEPTSTYILDEKGEKNMTQAIKEARKLYRFRELKYVYSDKKKPEAVLIPIEDFFGLMETLQILQDKKLMRSIKRGLDDVKKGNILTHDEVFD